MGRILGRPEAVREAPRGRERAISIGCVGWSERRTVGELQLRHEAEVRLSGKADTSSLVAHLYAFKLPMQNSTIVRHWNMPPVNPSARVLFTISWPILTFL